MQNSLIVDLPSPVAVVCHDAGAANHIVAWLMADGDVSRLRPYMAGPAAKIWQQNFPDVALLPSLEDALQGALSLLSGTGWATDIEHEARVIAKKKGLFSVGMVEHWVNYPERFIRGDVKLLPDEVWVVDEYAAAIAEQTLTGSRIRQKEDIYSQSMVSGLPKTQEIEANMVLYVLEPIHSTWGRQDSGEFQALDYFLENLSHLNLPEDVKILLRPHPSEPKGKYAAYAQKVAHPAIQIDEGDLFNALAASKWVAGCESFALTLALRAGREVICTLPPWAPDCRLPHKNIKHLKAIVPQ